MNVHNFLKNTLKYTIPSIVSAIIGIAVIPIISSIYPASEYGKINLFYSMGNMLMYIVMLGLDSAYIRFYFEPPKGTTKEQLFLLALYTGIFLDVLITVLATVFFADHACDYLFGEKKTWLLGVMMLYIIGLMLIRLLGCENRMENRATMYNIQQILLMFTNRVSFVFVAFFATDYEYSIIAISASSILIGLIFLVIQKRKSSFRLPRIPGKTVRSILKFSIPLLPTTVMVWANNSVAKMVLSGYGAFNEVGILSIATSVANVFTLLPTAFSTYWSSYMYSSYKTEQNFIKKVHNYIMMISIVLTLGIFLFQDILYFIVGAEYKASQAYFILIMMGPIQSLLAETTSYGIVLSNKTKYNFYISLIALLFNLGACVWLYPIMGIFGVVIGISGSAIIQFIVKTIIGQKYYASVESMPKMFGGLFLIIVICAINVLVWSNLVLRIAITLVCIAMTYIIYKDDVQQAAYFIRRSIREFKLKHD